MAKIGTDRDIVDLLYAAQLDLEGLRHMGGEFKRSEYERVVNNVECMLNHVLDMMDKRSPIINRRIGDKL